MLTPTNVAIGFSGVEVPAGHAHILVGQQLDFAIDTGGYGSSSDTYAWSISDGKPFRYYFEGTSWASLTPWSPVPTANDFCYFGKYVPGAATITCTAYLASIGQSVTVS